MRKGACRLQNTAERVVGMSVVHHHVEWLSGLDLFEASRNAAYMLERSQDVVRLKS